MLFSWLEITATVADHLTLLALVALVVFLHHGEVRAVECAILFYTVYSTYLHTAQPDVVISTKSEVAMFSEPFQATCTGSLQPSVAIHLLQYLTVDWIGTNGESLNLQEGMKIEQEEIGSNYVSKTLVFDPLRMPHGGDYTCEANVILPNSSGSFNMTIQHHINVLSENIIDVYLSYGYDNPSVQIWSSCSLFQVVRGQGKVL